MTRQPNALRPPLAAALLAIGAAAIFPALALANVCIQRPVRVRHLQGATVAVGGPNGEEPLPGVPIRIEPRDGRGAAITLTTDVRGGFSLESLPPGHYQLIAESRPFAPLSIHLVLRRTWFWQGRDRRQVMLRFGLDPTTPCGGSSAVVRKPAPDTGGR
jgi:hypothetical protein